MFTAQSKPMFYTNRRAQGGFSDTECFPFFIIYVTSVGIVIIAATCLPVQAAKPVAHANRPLAKKSVTLGCGSAVSPFSLHFADANKNCNIAS